jgi:hypothetical protein
MADCAGVTSLPGTDEQFQREQNKILIEFASGFDAWMARVTANGADMLQRGGLDLGAIIHGGDELANGLEELQRIDDSREELLYDLSAICRNYVIGDLVAWAFLQHRLGMPLRQVVESITDRAAATETATYYRKFRVGVGQIEPDNHDYDQSEWGREAWKVAVEQPMARTINDVIVPMLTEHDERVRSGGSRDEPRRVVVDLGDRPASILGKNLTFLRELCSWTIENLADAVGLDRSSVLGHINHGVQPRPSTLAAYSSAFTARLGKDIAGHDLGDPNLKARILGTVS